MYQVRSSQINFLLIEKFLICQVAAPTGPVTEPDRGCGRGNIHQPHQVTRQRERERERTSVFVGEGEKERESERERD